MSNPHHDPAANGQRFGEVIVTVDLDAMDCVVRAPRPGPVMPVNRATHYHSFEEIMGAYTVQRGLAAQSEVAADTARALKHAGELIRARQKEKRRER